MHEYARKTLLCEQVCASIIPFLTPPPTSRPFAFHSMPAPVFPRSLPAPAVGGSTADPGQGADREGQRFASWEAQQEDPAALVHVTRHVCLGCCLPRRHQHEHKPSWRRRWRECGRWCSGSARRPACNRTGRWWWWWPERWQRPATFSSRQGQVVQVIHQFNIGTISFGAW